MRKLKDIKEEYFDKIDLNNDWQDHDRLLLADKMSNLEEYINIKLDTIATIEGPSDLMILYFSELAAIKNFIHTYWDKFLRTDNNRIDMENYYKSTIEELIEIIEKGK